METASEVQEQHILVFLTGLPKAQVEKPGVFISLSTKNMQNSKFKIQWLLGNNLTKLQDQIGLPVVKTN